MTAVISFATSRMGLLVIAFAGVIIFYEGVPIGPLRYVPYAGKYLAMVVDGRVDREYARGRDDVQAEARAAALKAIQDRGQDNEEISKLDEMHLCQELGGRWIDTEARCD